MLYVFLHFASFCFSYFFLWLTFSRDLTQIGSSFHRPYYLENNSAGVFKRDKLEYHMYRNMASWWHLSVLARLKPQGTLRPKMSPQNWNWNWSLFVIEKHAMLLPFIVHLKVINVLKTASKPLKIILKWLYEVFFQIFGFFVTAHNKTFDEHSVAKMLY